MSIFTLVVVLLLIFSFRSSGLPVFICLNIKMVIPLPGKMASHTLRKWARNWYAETSPQTTSGSCRMRLITSKCNYYEKGYIVSQHKLFHFHLLSWSAAAATALYQLFLSCRCLPSDWGGTVMKLFSFFFSCFPLAASPSLFVGFITGF